MHRCLTLIVTFILLAIMAEPAVAWDTYPTGERDVSQWVTLEADASGGYSHTFNLSDPANVDLLNYPQNVQPWLNETGYKGSFTGPFLPPALINVYNGSPVKTMVQGLTLFKSNQVMSGSSYSWWRVPVEDPDSTSVMLKIWHIQNPGLLNWTSASYPYPVAINHPTLVFNNTFNLRQVAFENVTFHWFNNTDYWGDNHTWAWVRVVAPLHSDEHYAYQWTVTSTPTAVRVYYSLNDIGDDSIYKSWVYTSTEGWVEGVVDIDCSVVHQFGMGYSVSGLEFDAVSDDVSINFASKLSRPIQYDEYVTFLMPFIHDVDNTTNVHVSIRDETSHWSKDWWVADDGPTDFTIKSFVWHESDPGDTFYINVTFQNQTNKLFIYDPASIFHSTFEDDGTYATHRLRIFRDPMYPNGTYLYFRPYHSLQATNGSWENVWIDPVFVLDGHVIDFWGILENLDVSEFYPWQVKLVNGFWSTVAAIHNGREILTGSIRAHLRENLGLDGIPDGSIVDSVARALGALGLVLIKIGVWLSEFMDAFADNASWVFSMFFKIIIMILAIPLFVAYILMLMKLKRFFVIMVKCGPLHATRFGEKILTDVQGQVNRVRSVIRR